MWHYSQDGQRKGPVSDEDLRRMASEGTLKPSDLVWREGMSEWQPASQATGFQFAAASPAPPAPPAAPATPPTYAQQSTPYAPPGAQIEPSGEPIPNYLPWAIAATLLCCLPAGIASIVFAVKANAAKNVGNWAEARRNAKQAKTWLWVSVGVGLAVIVLYLLLALAGGLSGEF